MASGATARRALVVYSRVGGGHLSAARALGAELEARGADVQLVDAYLQCGRFPTTWFPRAYATLARHRPGLWALVYFGSDRLLQPTRALAPFVRNGFLQLMRTAQPEVVISVLPAINGLLASAAGRAGARLEVVLTDWHSVHRFWVAPGVDHYTAPTDSAREDCIRFGAPAQRVEVIGIPVRAEFAGSRDDQREALASLDLDPLRFTILAMVGAEGSPRALRNIARLAQAADLADAQLVVICGNNTELRERIERLPARMRVRALGFVHDVARLMRAADLLVTKAGGVTLAEAFSCGVPVVVHDVLPGQEAGNLEYVLDRQAVLYAPAPGALARLVAELRADARRRADLAAHGARLARPQATRQIVDGVLQRLDLRRS